MANEPITTPHAPAPVGPYSQGIRAGNLIAVAGQVGIDPATGEPVDADITAQTRRAIGNMAAVLNAAGATLRDLVRVGVYLTDPADFAAMNLVYDELIPPPRPARTTVYAGLPPGLRVELDALAFLGPAGADL
jgi:reactive intermediate/imine deaminase